jgi:hypothetical protein
MSTSHEDPLFERLRALPRADVEGPLAEKVRRLALAELEAPPRAGLRQILAAAAVASGVLVYFCWALAFVLLARV